MTSENLQKLQKIAIEASLLGAEVLKKYFKNITVFEEKEDAGGIVTKADKESEAVIRDFLKSKTPSFDFLGEEDGLVKNNSEATWIVDPLDGTSNFYHGFPLTGFPTEL